MKINFKRLLSLQNVIQCFSETNVIDVIEFPIVDYNKTQLINPHQFPVMIHKENNILVKRSDIIPLFWHLEYNGKAFCDYRMLCTIIQSLILRTSHCLINNFKIADFSIGFVWSEESNDFVVDILKD